MRSAVEIVRIWFWPSIRFIVITAILRFILQSLDINVDAWVSSAFSTMTHPGLVAWAIIGLLGLVTTFAIEAGWQKAWAKITRTLGRSDVSLPIDIRMSSNFFAARAHLHEDEKVDPMLIEWAKTSITNISSHRKVALDVILRIKIDGKVRYSVTAGEADGFGFKLSTHGKFATIQAANKIQTKNYLNSPLAIEPQETKDGALAFLLDLVLNAKGKLEFLKADAENRISSEMTIKDRISGKSLEIAIVRSDLSYRGDTDA